ncbi:hypothetical protein PF008_g32953 [Phytophthora fragariae]|uniref:Uncharacterized protein n=1 Tax=Phytophthora fragariae TaxID=53985 RepID=A0A6G0PYA9_9STRA|nr:hypothetical protein PF008_g32953 [Phytophthora fragariae]
MKKACANLGLRHMSCSAHSLHLVVDGALLLKSKEQSSADVEDASDDDSDTDSIHPSGGLPREGGDKDDVAAFVDSSASSRLNLQREQWIDNRLEELERLAEGECVDSQCEPSEWISDADIDDLCNEVETFVSVVEKSATDKVNSSDLEAVRKTVQGFRKLSTYFHHSQNATNRVQKLQSDKKMRSMSWATALPDGIARSQCLSGLSSSS